MTSRTRVRFKYLFWGLVIGAFFAPRSGKETRAKFLGKAGSAVDFVLRLI